MSTTETHFLHRIVCPLLLNSNTNHFKYWIPSVVFYGYHTVLIKIKSEEQRGNKNMDDLKSTIHLKQVDDSEKARKKGKFVSDCGLDYI